jgi:hypothetical protein
VGTQVEVQSLEAEIAEQCQVIRTATEIDVAMDAWARLRRLIAQKTAAEDKMFIKETATLARTSPKPPAMLPDPTPVMAPVMAPEPRPAGLRPSERAPVANDIRHTPILSLSPLRF